MALCVGSQTLMPTSGDLLSGLFAEGTGAASEANMRLCCVRCASAGGSARGKHERYRSVLWSAHGAALERRHARFGAQGRMAQIGWTGLEEP